MEKRESLNVTFVVELQKSPAKGGWYFVVWPHSAEFFGTRGLVKVRGFMYDQPFQSAFMAMGGGVHKLPVATKIAKRLGKSPGDALTVQLDERMDRRGGRAGRRGRAQDHK
jgi:Domain of unknown function (DUF1905)